MSLFELGRVVTTCGVAEKMQNDISFGIGVVDALERHSKGDWGNISDDDRDVNNEAVKNGDDGIMSSYTIGSTEIWIMTEWNRSVTTVLFPEEY